MIYLICSVLNVEAGIDVKRFLEKNGVPVYFPKPHDSRQTEDKLDKADAAVVVAGGHVPGWIWFESGYMVGGGKTVYYLQIGESDLDNNKRVYKNLVLVQTPDELGRCLWENE